MVPNLPDPVNCDDLNLLTALSLGQPFCQSGRVVDTRVTGEIFEIIAFGMTYFGNVSREQPELE